MLYALQLMVERVLLRLQETLPSEPAFTEVAYEWCHFRDGNTQLCGGVPLTQSHGVVLYGLRVKQAAHEKVQPNPAPHGPTYLVINGDAKWNTNFVGAGISTANGLTSRVHLEGGKTSFKMRKVLGRGYGQTTITFEERRSDLRHVTILAMKPLNSSLSSNGNTEH